MPVLEVVKYCYFIGMGKSKEIYTLSCYLVNIYTFTSPYFRQHCRLSICIYFGWLWQTLRRLRQPLQSGCEIFEEPQLSENWLQLSFSNGLALPHMSIYFWVYFWHILFTFQQLRRSFLPALLSFPLLKFGGTLLLVCTITQIWGSTPIGRHKTN